MSVTDHVAARVREWVGAWPAKPEGPALYRILRFLSQWRSHTLASTFVAKQGGAVVHGGLFAGMRYLDASTEGALMPRLLGTYESELHPHLDALLAAEPEAIVDIGCAEGYYAVGLARLAPRATIYAHDIDERAQAACAALARLNDVGDRVRVGGEFRPEAFERFAGLRALVIVDAEGAEVDILRPDLAPALKSASIVVETHDVYRTGAEAAIRERFAPTHDIVRVVQQPKAFEPLPWLDASNQLDQLIAVWEFRLAPTPWLVMTPRSA